MFPRVDINRINRPLVFFERIPRPFAQNPWMDAVYIGLIAVLQTTILPTFFPQDLVVDLLTPWLAVSMVLLPPTLCLPLMVLAALIIETHSAAPAGLYISAYWMLGVAITLSAHAIAWTNKAPWLSLVILSETWLFAAEFLVGFLAGQEPSVEPRYYIFQILRFGLSAYFGFVVAMMFAPGIDKGKSIHG